MGYENDYTRLQKKTTKRQNDRAKPDICIRRNPLVRGLAPTEKGGVLLPPTTYLYPAKSLSPWVGTYFKAGGIAKEGTRSAGQRQRSDGGRADPGADGAARRAVGPHE